VSQGQIKDATYATGSTGMGFYLQGTSGVNGDYGFTRFTATAQEPAAKTERQTIDAYLGVSSEEIHHYGNHPISDLSL
jgi:hypothetical protein